MAEKEEEGSAIRFLSLVFEEEQKVRGLFADACGKEVLEEISCDYRNHETSRSIMGRFLYQLFSQYTGRTLPWGTLTGIRPSKIVMKWLEEGMEPEQILKRFQETYLADEQKAQLCLKVAQKEKTILDAHSYEEEYSLYIGIPFCPTTCLYCSFASFPVSKFADRMEPYLEALFQEMRFVAQTYRNRPLTTVYVGGGTPTALDEPSLEKLMHMIHELFPMDKIREFTVEAVRPDSITEALGRAHV